MVLMNVLRNVLNAIVNAERTNKRQVMVRPCSKVVIRFLRVMQKHGMELFQFQFFVSYLFDFEYKFDA